jgi:hypothetical protein
MATSLTLQNDASLAQGYVKVNGTTSATFTTSGITGNLVGNVTGNVTGNADTATKLSTTTGSAPSYACRAWVNFDGTGSIGSNQTIRANGNVASVLKNAAGDYTITFTTAMADANYSAVGTARMSGTLGSSADSRILQTRTFATGTLQVYCTNGPSNNGSDSNIICVQIFS